MRRIRIAASAAALLAVVAQAPTIVAAATLPAECSALAGIVTCTYTSGDNAFTVPAGVTSVDIVAVGGAGAGASGATGGAGAMVSGSLSVTAGATLHAVVGGNASDGVGGANGGAGSGSCAGGGGGASDVRTSAAIEDRVLVAAGGGGAGCSGRVASDPATPGGNGGDAGSSGTAATQSLNDVPYGGLGGGAGCASALATSCGAGGLGSVNGDDGSLGNGGAGGDTNGRSGGGGGGGLYGGGGGGGGSISQTCTFLGCVIWIAGGGGGGGGGSNLVPAGGTASADSTGVPIVTISYAEPAPAASLDSTSLDFGSALIGTVTATQTVTLTNTGTATLSVSVPSLTGANITDFRITSNGCTNANLAPGEHCQEQVAFSPTTMGTRTATLRFSDNAGDSPQDVTLSGFGTTATADVGIRLGAAPGTGKLGRTLRYTITVSNAGPGDAGSVVVRDTLPTQATFVSSSISAGSCGTPAAGAITCSIPSIGVGAKVTIQILVTPTASGTTLANSASVTTLSVDPNLANNTASITTRIR